MSAKTIADKLLIKPNTTLWLSHPERVGLLGPLPEAVQLVDRMEGATTAVLFVDDTAALQALLAAQHDALATTGALWVAYPKGNKVDVNRDTLWPQLSPYGMRPIAQVAIDEVWSALRFRPIKEGEAPFSGGKS